MRLWLKVPRLASIVIVGGGLATALIACDSGIPSDSPAQIAATSTVGSVPAVPATAGPNDRGHLGYFNFHASSHRAATAGARSHHGDGARADPGSDRAADCIWTNDGSKVETYSCSPDSSSDGDYSGKRRSDRSRCIGSRDRGSSGRTDLRTKCPRPIARHQLPT